MQIETTKIIQEQFKTLPPVIQDTITNSNWQEKIRRVVKNNSLHVDQGAAIENLVLITMLGLENPDDFVNNAKEYAQVSEDAAYTISSEVEREIFGDIRRKLIALTETADTVADVDREANSELNKVAEDIENAVKISSKPSLKDKIPSDYFDKNKKVEAPIMAKQETGLKPITTQITAPIGALEKKPEEPKVLTAIEKELIDWSVTTS